MFWIDLIFYLYGCMLLISLYILDPFGKNSQLCSVFTSILTFSAAPITAKFMLNRISVLESLQSVQIAKFYTGIKSVAYIYQIIVIYMYLLLLYNYGVFSSEY